MGKDTEKFLFNQHIFDEPDIEEEEEEPPPPTYSQEELETARQDTYKRAYEQGKKDGLAESMASREQMVAETLKKIAQDTSIIFAAEDHREKLFERESVLLASAIFEKLFPQQKTLHGFDELKQSLSAILKKQENQSEIRIEVHPEAAEGIQEHINSLSLAGQSQQRFDIVENDNMDKLAAKIYWKDGGAIKDIDAIAGQIRTILHETLASSGLNSHDSTEEDASIDLENQKGMEPASDEQIDGHDAAMNDGNEIEEHEEVEKPDE